MLHFHPSAQVHPLMHHFGAPSWKALLPMDKPVAPSSPDMTCSSVIAGPSLLEWAHPIALITFELPLGTQLRQHHEPPSEPPLTYRLQYIGAVRSNVPIRTVSPTGEDAPGSRSWISHEAHLRTSSMLQKLTRQYWVEFMCLQWYGWHLQFLPLPFGHSQEHLDVLNDDGSIFFLFLKFKFS